MRAELPMLIVAAMAVGAASAFITQSNVGYYKNARSSALWQSQDISNDPVVENPNVGPPLFNRREAITKPAAAAIATVVGSFVIDQSRNNLAFAEETTDIGKSPEHPIVVIGGGGKVGPGFIQHYCIHAGTPRSHTK